MGVEDLYCVFELVLEKLGWSPLFLGPQGVPIELNNIIFSKAETASKVTCYCGCSAFRKST